MLRIPPPLHALLRRAARAEGMSLNDYCTQRLTIPVGNLSALDGPAAAVRKAGELFGDAVVGVVAFGSWARGEATEASDVDLVIVLERNVPLSRKLYQAWDAAPLTWGRHPVEPQFVHLPESQETVAGIWAEVAIDGIVFFERGLEVSTRLVRIRTDIVSGRIVRRFAHGQPYWIENEVGLK